MLLLQFLLLFLMALHLPATQAAALNATCFAPTSQGGLGFCGPAACNASAVRSTKPTCTFTNQAVNYANAIPGCRVCAQSSLPSCSAASLKALVVGSGIRAAYCTDAHLVIISDGTPSWTANLDDVPNPPGSVQPGTGVACVTRSASITSSLLKWKVPLSYTLLSTASSTNNMAAFPDGASDSYMGYMSNNKTGAAYGLPTRGSVGISVSGTDIFPLYNNRAELTDDSCEVDSCNMHVGGGGGQPHLHGDPFGPWCLYSAANYTSQTVHPPQIGWSLDGPSIYGRYLYTTSLGYSTPLDDCGGHDHDSLGYHYHTQVLDATTTTPIQGLASGIAYTYSTVGVNKCWRADISKITGFWDSSQNSAYLQPCCNMTQYYSAPGTTFSGSAAASAPPASPPASTPSPTAPCVQNCSPQPASPAPGSAPAASSSPAASSPMASPAASPAATIVKRVQHIFQGMDYNALVANATKLAQFSTEVRLSLAIAARIDASYIRILSVTAGSVATTSELTFPTSQYTTTQAEQATSSTLTSPSTVFSSSFTNTYGVTSVTATDVTNPSSGSSSLSTGAIIGIAVGGGVGLLLAVLLVVVLVVKRRRSATAPQPATAVKAHPVDHDV